MKVTKTIHTFNRAGVNVSESCGTASDGYCSAAETDALPVNGDDDISSCKSLHQHCQHHHHHHVADDDDESWRSAGDAVGNDVTAVSVNDVTLTVDSLVSTDDTSSNGVSSLSAVDTNGVSTLSTVDTNGASTLSAVDTNGVSTLSTVDTNGASTLSTVDTNGVSTLSTVHGASTTSTGDSVSCDGSFNGFIVAMHRKMVLSHCLCHICCNSLFACKLVPS